MRQPDTQIIHTYRIDLECYIIPHVGEMCIFRYFIVYWLHKIVRSKNLIIPLS